MYNSNENVLEDRLPQHYIDVKLTLWKKSSILRDFKACSLFTTMHIYNEKYLICYSQKTQLHGVYINRQSLVIEENFIFQGEQFDYQLVHHQTYFTKNCIWFISYNRNTSKQIFYADLPTKTIYAIQNFNKPLFRINFSFTQRADLQFLIFGGFDDQMKLSNALDLFDIVQCDFLALTVKGQPPSPRHSHLACINSNRLIIAGGSSSLNLFERTCLQDMFVLDLKTYVWSQIKSNIPKNIAFGQQVSLNQNQIIYFSEESGNITHYLLSLTDYQWVCIRSQKDVPAFKYKASVCLDIKNNQVLMFGGLNLQKNSLNCTIIYRLQLILKDFKEPTLEAYNGEIINLNKFERQQPIQQLPEEPKDNEQQEELTFEELLEQEKQLQQLDELKQEQKKNKKKSKKKTKNKSKN